MLSQEQSKANFPTRISFQVTSKIDSRTILGEQGQNNYWVKEICYICHQPIRLLEFMLHMFLKMK